MTHSLRVYRRRLVLFVLFSTTVLAMTFLRGYRSSTSASFRYPSSYAIGATLAQSDLRQLVRFEIKEHHTDDAPYDQPRSNDKWRGKKRLPWEDDISAKENPETSHPSKDASNSYLAPWRLKYQGWTRDLLSLDILEPPRPPVPRQEAFLRELVGPSSGSLVARAVVQDAKA